MGTTATPAARLNEEPQAALRFARAPDGQSYIARQRVGYPFHITRPFYLDEVPAGALTLYLQSVSGGIYQGEDLRLTCAAGPGCAAHVTTQAATIVHRMPAAPARQTVALAAEGDALLEYLPDPLIMFPGARLTSVLEIDAAADATVVASESFSHHDPGGEDRRFDRFRAEMRLRDENGRLLALERYEVAGDRLAPGRGGQAARWPAQGSLRRRPPRAFARGDPGRAAHGACADGGVLRRRLDASQRGRRRRAPAGAGRGRAAARAGGGVARGAARAPWRPARPAPQVSLAEVNKTPGAGLSS